jgi:NADH dehydrogenase [ubiquinone] 1 alpha subcomplex assembly factor 7
VRGKRTKGVLEMSPETKAFTDFLREESRRTGSLSVEHFHTLALTHPVYGYYRRQEVLGSQGDFVTAPEVSPLFGEILGAVLVAEWESFGAPDVFSLVELGPGRGTLLSDILRVGRLRPSFNQAAETTLVEIHPKLQALQNQALGGRTRSLAWAETVSEMTERVLSQPGPVFVIANEFFDALPVQQWVLEGNSWRERRIIWTEDDGGRFVWSPETEGSRVRETSLVRETVMGELCQLLAQKGGLLFLIDYGFEGGVSGDSWAGIREGKASHPMDFPGETDLSAHVDFANLKEIADQTPGLQTAGPFSQKDFLENNGIRLRLEALQKKASRSQRAVLEAAYLRLTHPLQMGSLFKVLLVSSHGTPPKTCTLEASQKTL